MQRKVDERRKMLKNKGTDLDVKLSESGTSLGKPGVPGVRSKSGLHVDTSMRKGKGA